jgi:hypothetical protein
MSFEHTARVHKDVMTVIANILRLDELTVEPGATVIFSPGDPACDFALVRWTADDDYLDITLDHDALGIYIQRLRANREKLRQDLNTKRPRRATQMEEAITNIEVVLRSFEAARRES